jgi:hypothetical protein
MRKRRMKKSEKRRRRRTTTTTTKRKRKKKDVNSECWKDNNPRPCSAASSALVTETQFQPLFPHHNLR